MTIGDHIDCPLWPQTTPGCGDKRAAQFRIALSPGVKRRVHHHRVINTVPVARICPVKLSTRITDIAFGTVQSKVIGFNQIKPRDRAALYNLR